MAKQQITTDQVATSSVWSDWTPTVANATVTSTTYAKYKQIGKTVFFRFRVVVSAVSGAVTITLPVNIGSYNQEDTIAGSVLFFDAATNLYQGQFWVTGSATTLGFRAMVTSGTYGAYGGGTLSSTVPFSWGAGDIMQGSGMYEAA